MTATMWAHPPFFFLLIKDLSTRRSHAQLVSRGKNFCWDDLSVQCRSTNVASETKCLLRVPIANMNHAGRIIKFTACGHVSHQWWRVEQENAISGFCSYHLQCEFWGALSLLLVVRRWTRVSVRQVLQGRETIASRYLTFQVHGGDRNGHWEVSNRRCSSTKHWCHRAEPFRDSMDQEFVESKGVMYIVTAIERDIRPCSCCSMMPLGHSWLFWSTHLSRPTQEGDLGGVGTDPIQHGLGPVHLVHLGPKPIKAVDHRDGLDGDLQTNQASRSVERYDHWRKSPTTVLPHSSVDWVW